MPSWRRVSFKAAVCIQMGEHQARRTAGIEGNLKNVHFIGVTIEIKNALGSRNLRQLKDSEWN